MDYRNLTNQQIMNHKKTKVLKIWIKLYIEHITFLKTNKYALYIIYKYIKGKIKVLKMWNNPYKNIF